MSCPKNPSLTLTRLSSLPTTWALSDSASSSRSPSLSNMSGTGRPNHGIAKYSGTLEQEDELGDLMVGVAQGNLVEGETDMQMLSMIREVMGRLIQTCLKENCLFNVISVQKHSLGKGN